MAGAVLRIAASRVRSRFCAGQGKLALEPCGESLDRAMAIQLQQVHDVAARDNDGVAILLDLSIRLDIHVACRHENAELTMSET